MAGEEHPGAAFSGVPALRQRSDRAGAYLDVAGSGMQAIFREARCANAACGWHYFKHEGSREEFVSEVNRRITDGDGD